MDWNFPGAGNTAKSVHAVHWFPGNFIPQIPSHLIQILSAPGEVVLDPFGGSGTTAIEALKLGRHAISSDRVTPCLFISRAKLSLLRFPIGERTKSEVLSKLAWVHLCETDEMGFYGEGSNPRLSKWYAGQTLRQLNFLWKLIENYSDATREILELVFSDVLFACASPGRSKTSTGKIRRHHWGWIADNVLPVASVKHDAISAFQERLIDLPVWTAGLPAEREIFPAVIQQDARRMALAASSVDLIVTSPPYVGMIDYSRANRLLYLWKGWDLDSDRNSEIGARYKRSRREVKEEYLKEMAQCWAEFSRVLRPGGFCAVVIGESRRFPGAVDHTLKDLGRHMSLVWGPERRTLARRRVSGRTASEAVEYVGVFKRD